MTLPPGLAADLRTLSAAIDDSSVYIADTLTQLGRTAAAGVKSYLGMSVAVTVGPDILQLSTMSERHTGVASSVAIPLTAVDAPLMPATATTIIP